MRSAIWITKLHDNRGYFVGKTLNVDENVVTPGDVISYGDLCNITTSGGVDVYRCDSLK